MIRRQPKLGGFISPTRVDVEILNLDTLEAKVPAGKHDRVTLVGLRLIRGKKPLKILGRGAVTKKFSITAYAVSKSAKAAIEKAGGSVTIAKI